MQSQRALAVLDELRSLAAEDDTRLCVAKDRLAVAEAEVTAARSAFDSANMRAEVSQRVTRSAEELLAPATSPQAGPPRPPHREPALQEEPRTIAQEVLAFVRPRRRAKRAEILKHLHLTRPDINPASAKRRLSHLVADKELVRVAPGVYTLPPMAAEGDA
ncbi:hypothetical protein OG887_17095 [Streptomyces sp. NBC_00053]|uniref:hypothetical protein n=1 Tax=unclassified Streptomyces TaxID=2593676 RepID=UPI002255434A|nr:MULTISPECIES: hypothetical protein [unclassified Streptomyces]WSG51396.1 hypothetical protein OHA38_17230 [Streptomyces sp. NBC_01732]WSX02053.1 hypothetical protein OG355_17355 [Streptomyces sp. NBC_00987]MCX5160841.1 hypothetical protein [Streptomyces sp. NBC_00305]MCX5219364.1 hypothetical protein [Streptomyces sp. NBC_00264]MCX5501084.1 hypothetical protein [Streptomyces sp. NBC_00052]